MALDAYPIPTIATASHDIARWEYGRDGAGENHGVGGPHAEEQALEQTPGAERRGDADDADHDADHEHGAHVGAVSPAQPRRREAEQGR